MLVLREESGVTDVVSSHDLVVTGMQTHKRKSVTQQHERMEKQVALLARYNHDIDTLFSEWSTFSDIARRDQTIVIKLYDLFTGYTRDTLSVYMDTHSVDARFAPVHHVSTGDHIHKCTTQHLTLFRQISGMGDWTLQEALQLDYTNLLLAYMHLYAKDVQQTVSLLPEMLDIEHQPNRYEHGC